MVLSPATVQSAPGPAEETRTASCLRAAVRRVSHRGTFDVSHALSTGTRFCIYSWSKILVSMSCPATGFFHTFQDLCFLQPLKSLWQTCSITPKMVIAVDRHAYCEEFEFGMFSIGVKKYQCGSRYGFRWVFSCHALHSYGSVFDYPRSRARSVEWMINRCISDEIHLLLRRRPNGFAIRQDAPGDQDSPAGSEPTWFPAPRASCAASFCWFLTLIMAECMRRAGSSIMAERRSEANVISE